MSRYEGTASGHPKRMSHERKESQLESWLSCGPEREGVLLADIGRVASGRERLARGYRARVRATVSVGFSGFR